MKLQGICGLSDGKAGDLRLRLGFFYKGKFSGTLFLHTEARQFLISAKIAFMRPIS